MAVSHWLASDLAVTGSRTVDNSNSHLGVEPKFDERTDITVRLNVHEHSVCAIPKNSDRAELMRATSTIVWDEIGAQHCLAVETGQNTSRPP